MTREELLGEKALWEQRLQKVNLELSEAKRRAFAERVYLPAVEFNALVNDRAKLVSGLRGIAMQLAMRKGKHFADYFYEAADDVIEDAELFDKIYDLAEARMKTERGVRQCSG